MPRLKMTVTTHRERQLQPLMAKVSSAQIQRNKLWILINITSCLTTAVEYTHSCLKAQFLLHARQMVTR